MKFIHQPMIIFFRNQLGEQYNKVLYDVLPIVWIRPSKKTQINETVCIQANSLVYCRCVFLFFVDILLKLFNVSLIALHVFMFFFIILYLNHFFKWHTNYWLQLCKLFEDH